MFNFSNRVRATRFWGSILLFLGILATMSDIGSLFVTGKWEWMSFLDAIKIGARETITITSGEWVYEPRSFIWLHDYLDWLPLSPTLVCLGILGYFAPSIQKKATDTAAEFAKLMVR